MAWIHKANVGGHDRARDIIICLQHPFDLSSLLNKNEPYSRLALSRASTICEMYFTSWYLPVQPNAQSESKLHLRMPITKQRFIIQAKKEPELPQRRPCWQPKCSFLIPLYFRVLYSTPTPSSGTVNVPSLSSNHRARSAACRRMCTTAAAPALSRLVVVWPPALIMLSASLGLPTWLVSPWWLW